jgi:hypothetical protein
MSELTKQALRVDNNQSFPNNNAGLITPSALRTFNENMIDSNVNQTAYTADSASFNSRINAITGSATNTGSLLTTASFNDSTRNLTFTKGDSSQFSVNIPDVSGSVLPGGVVSGSSQITALGFVSSSVTGSSLVTASFAAQTLTFTKGDGGQFSLFIPDNSGSVLPSGVVSSSQQISGLGFQTTASFNTYTSSNDSKVNSLINATSSYAISSSVAAVDLGQQLQINSLIAATSSYATSAITASSLITASFSGNTLTFTKGDATTFGVVIPDVSGSGLPSGVVSGSSQIILQQTTGNLSGSRIDGLVASASFATTASFALNAVIQTGSFATTGSNVFVGNQTITGSLFQSGSLIQNGISELTGSVNISGSTTIKGTTTFLDSSTTITGSLLISGSTTQIGNNLLRGSTILSGSVFVSGNIEITNGANLITHNVKAAGSNGLDILANNGATIATMGQGGGTQANFPGSLSSGQFSASVITGLGSPTGFSASVDSRLDGLEASTSSLFTSASLGLVTASFSGNTLTFTKGDATTFGVVIPDVSGSTINTGSFATTGSNTFNGNQIVNGNVKQTITAPTTDTQTDFVSVNGTVIDGTAFNYVNFGIVDYPSVGNAYKDAFAIEYYDSLSYTYGAEFTVNPKQIGSSMNLSGSAIGISQLRDLGGNKTFLNQYASIINIGSFAAGTTDLIYIGHNQLPVLRLSSLKNEITGSTTISGSVNILSTLTASIQEGFVLAGGAGNVSTLVATSSFGGGGSTDISSLNAFTASQQALNTTFATTGSNNFIGNQTITGSLTISGSAVNDVRVVGKILTTGSTALIENTDGVSIEYMGVAFGGNIGVASVANATEIGIALSGGAWTTNWGNGPILYVNNTPGDTYEGVFGFQNKTNYTDGRITALKRLDVSGSVNIQNTLTASLQQGYVWVGDANGRTTTVSTGSFGGGGSAFPFTGSAQITGSLGITGSISEFVNTLTIASSTASVNFNDGNMFTLTLVTGSVTHITPTNIRRGQTINIQINQPAGASSGSVSFSPNVLFAGGNDYQATATGSAIDLLTFVSLDGTNVLGTSIKNFL